MSDQKTTFGQVPIGGHFESSPNWGRWTKTSHNSARKGVDGQACYWDDADPVWVEGEELPTAHCSLPTAQTEGS